MVVDHTDALRLIVKFFSQSEYFASLMRGFFMELSMTVPVPDQLEFISDADGAIKDFPYPRRFLQADEVVVTLRDADGLEIPQYLNQHYSIAGSSWPNGGTVSFYNAPAAGLKVVRTRMTQAKQTVDLENRQKNDAKAVELQLDRLTMAIQDRGSLLSKLWGLASSTALGLLNEITDRINGDKAVASLIGQAGTIEVPLFDTSLALALANVKPTISSVRTGGFRNPRDGGGASYYRKTAPISDMPGDVTSNGGSIRWGLITNGAVFVAQFGVIGDGVTDDTIALQAAFDFGALTGVLVDFGKPLVCLVTNLIIKDTEVSVYTADKPLLRVNGRGAVVKKKAGGHDAFVIAPERWVINDQYPQYPNFIYNLQVDGAGIANFGIVVWGYFGAIEGTRVFNCVLDGIHCADYTHNGTTLRSGHVVENVFRRLHLYNNGRNGLNIPGQVGFTDWTLEDSFIFNNGSVNAVWEDCAGAFIQRNHMYHTVPNVSNGGVVIGRTFGASIAGNIFEGDPADTNGTIPCVIIKGNAPSAVLEGNSFWSRVSCMFSPTCTLIKIANNKFLERARLWHEADDATKILISEGNTFNVADPYRLLNGGSHKGIVKAYSDTSQQSGVTYAGLIRQGEFPSAALRGGLAIDQDSDYPVKLNDPDLLLWIRALSATRSVNLTLTGPFGRIIRVVRPAYASGAFGLNVNGTGGTVKTLSAGTWADFYFNGSVWICIGSGSL